MLRITVLSTIVGLAQGVAVKCSDICGTVSPCESSMCNKLYYGCGEYHEKSDAGNDYTWKRTPCTFTDGNSPSVTKEMCMKEMINEDKSINVTQAIADDIQQNKELSISEKDTQYLQAGYCKAATGEYQSEDKTVDFSGNQAICCKTVPEADKPASNSTTPPPTPDSASSVTVSMFSLAVVAVIASLTSLM